MDVDDALIEPGAERALVRCVRSSCADEVDAGPRRATTPARWWRWPVARRRRPFFDDVMVMADDPALRANRLALLHAVAATMNRVADISKLAP